MLSKISYLGILIINLKLREFFEQSIKIAKPDEAAYLTLITIDEVLIDFEVDFVVTVVRNKEIIYDFL